MTANAITVVDAVFMALFLPNANLCPAWGSAARSSSLLISRDEVMKSVSRSAPPKAQQVGFQVGTSITRSIVPSGATRTTLRPSHAAFPTPPSASHQACQWPGHSRRPLSCARACRQKNMVRPSAENQVELAQATPSISEVMIPSASIRMTELSAAPVASFMPLTISRPFRSVRPSFKRVPGLPSSKDAMVSIAPVARS